MVSYPAGVRPTVGDRRISGTHMSKQTFDNWPERYDLWFSTPVGALVKQYERDLILDMLQPRARECIADIGCGTGIFTQSVIAHGARVIGVDVSEPMLEVARRKLPAESFLPLAADMRVLPFGDGQFDKALSITALEFVADAEAAMAELFRVTRAGGHVVVATLNSLSPWAARRSENARDNDRSIFRHAYFRSPDQLRALAPVAGIVRTAIHFTKDTDPRHARTMEIEGRRADLHTGAFVVGCWQAP